VDSAVSTALFGGTLELGGSKQLPPGRGYVRVGSTGPVIRLQSPYVAPGSIAHAKPVEVVATVGGEPAEAPAPEPAAD
jgi:hypothetical protein